MTMNLKPAESPPGGVTIEPLPCGLRLRCSWFSLWAVGDLLGAIMIGGILVNLGWSFRQTLTADHLAIFGVVAVAVAYYCLVRIVNSTTIEISGDELRVAHGPLPSRLGTRFATRKLSSVQVTVMTDRLKYGGKVKRYWVWAGLKDGRQIKLLAALHSRDRAYYVQQLLEELIGELESSNPFLPEVSGHSERHAPIS